MQNVFQLSLQASSIMRFRPLRAGVEKGTLFFNAAQRIAHAVLAYSCSCRRTSKRIIANSIRVRFGDSMLYTYAYNSTYCMRCCCELFGTVSKIEVMAGR
jgi:hypothetical protein